MSKDLIQIRFLDGNEKEFSKGITLHDIAESISSSLKKKAIAGKVNGELYDLHRSINQDAEIEILTLESDEGLEIMRHTTAHILAQAVKRVHKNVKLGVGPVIEDGFYYDMDLSTTIASNELIQLEHEMKKIINENHPIERTEVTRSEAEKIFSEINDKLKLELLRDIPMNETVTIYKQGEFFDLCRGPHLPSTGTVKAFKLTKVSGAYWRGNSDNQMLQRVYGVAFRSQKQLNEYVLFLEEAAKRDHRKLGNELELFMFSDEAPGMPFYLAKGQMVKNQLEQFLRSVQEKHNYEEVRTPFMMNQQLWEKSGHWDHYK
ncbi:TGS domain-containing protein, partial [Priestia megaterium]|uniref:TGS domain-containing protein n=1 Tax=Priestia megaterium TaxID=1404 RepID=UPI002FFEC48C